MKRTDCYPTSAIMPGTLGNPSRDPSADSRFKELVERAAQAPSPEDRPDPHLLDRDLIRTVAETPEPDGPPDPEPSDTNLAQSILASGKDVRSDHELREDGWTPERIATFLNTLAEWGNVSDAVREAGVTRQAAYALRNSAKGRAFQLGWRAALLLARRRLADDLMSRAVNGQVDQIYRDGELWRERRRYDNRLALALLTRLDRQVAEAEIDPAARLVADEFEQFVAIAAADGAGAADFVRRRAARISERTEAELLERSENYGRYGVGHPAEIDVADLVADWQKGWSRAQIERAIHAKILRKLRPEDDDGDPIEPGRTRYAIVLPDLGFVGTLDV